MVPISDRAPDERRRGLRCPPRLPSPLGQPVGPWVTPARVRHGSSFISSRDGPAPTPAGTARGALIGPGICYARPDWLICCLSATWLLKMFRNDPNEERLPIADVACCFVGAHVALITENIALYLSIMRPFGTGNSPGLRVCKWRFGSGLVAQVVAVADFTSDCPGDTSAWAGIFVWLVCE